MKSSDDPTDTPEDSSADSNMPTTRIGRLEAVGRMGLRAGEHLVRSGARQLVSGRGAQAEASARRAAAEEIFATLGRMRGVAAKAGQLLAQNPTAFEPEYIDRLLDLSQRVPPMMFGLIKTQIQAELGCHPLQAFARFEREPFAAASLGQVHRAQEHDGRARAVKVQYPGVADTVRADLDNLRLLLRPAKLALALSNIDDALDEIEERLTEELDYRVEAANLRDFRAAFADHPDYLLPAVSDRSTRRVLIMDLVEGWSTEEYVARRAPHQQRAQYARRLLCFGWTATFQHGLLHADPNPGNYLFCPDERLGVVDFGCVKRLAPDRVTALRAVIGAARSVDRPRLDEALVQAGMLSADAQPAVRRVMADAVLLWTEPFRGRAYDFADGTFLRRQLASRGEFRRVATESAGMAMSRDWLFYSRYQMGVAHLLHRLGVTEDFSAALERFA